MHQFIPILRPPISAHDFSNEMHADFETEEEQNTQAADTCSNYIPLQRICNNAQWKKIMAISLRFSSYG